MTIVEMLEMEDQAFIAAIHPRLGAIVAEVQPSDYWAGGEEGGWTNDSNVYFDTPEEVQSYYMNRYRNVHVFDDAYDAEEMAEQLEAQSA